MNYIEAALEQLRLGPGINEDVSEEYNDAVNTAIQSLEQIKQIKHILKEWYLDSCLKGDDYMNEIREVLDK